jgi:cyclohexanecarboxylate-CoA ligase
VGAWHGGRLSMYTGAKLVLQDRWDPEAALSLVEEHGCVFTAAATPFLKDLVDAPWPQDRPKLAPLRYFLCGGAPVPPALVEQALEQTPHTFVTVLWGMTEGGVTTSVPGDNPVHTARLAGKPLPGLELKIIDALGQPAEQGELVMRGPGVFVGYLGQEDLFAESLTEDGFFRTGDLARIEPNGYLSLTGRLKDIIVRGGVNISPVPIENALAAHPQVQRVAVIGTPDPRLGERICAVVVTEDGVALDLDDVNRWLTERGLSKRLLPERLVQVPEMPATPAGKIRKVDLRLQVKDLRPDLVTQ